MAKKLTGEEQIWVDHHDFGHVLFSQMTPRQMDVLKKYDTIIELMKKHPNDAKLGAEVRKIMANRRP